MLDFFIESINIPEEDMAKISELNFKEALNLSKSKGDFKKSAYYCGDLVMLYMKKGDLINAYKYTSNLAGYAEGEAKPLVEEFCGQLEARINAGIKEPPEELVKKAEVICHKIRVGP
ncbi:MAG: hypothetical protein DDT24_00806 [Chloroflexi bacterium]|nr:hypothetical protein [Chloroflexota bacterium]